jgi:diaminobutyrate-2-oxoglutarate transaminase
MVGLEFPEPRVGTGRNTLHGLAGKVRAAAFARGLLVETGGRNDSVLRFMPPLTIDESDIALILERLAAALADVAMSREVAPTAGVQAARF